MASASRLKQAGFVVKGWSRSPKQASGIESSTGDDGLNALLGGSDVVVCLMPLTDETRGLLDSRRFAAMKEGAALIYFARGPIVVDADLIASLDAGHLSHAVLDVFHEEPLPAAIVAANIRAYRATGALPQTVDIERGN